MADDDVRVEDNPSLRRFELRVGDELMGEIVYRRRADDVLALLHTEVAPELGGRGLGSRLVATALDDARRRGLRVVPLCPFVDAFIRRNPAYGDLVVEDPARRA